MDDQRFGAVLRAVRQRRGWRQADVASLAGVSIQTVSRIERGHGASSTLRVLRVVARVLEIRLDLAPWSRHGDIVRFATADHAALVEGVLRVLAPLGWEARAEVSFSEHAERGFIDVLAWHAASRSLLVIEAKTQIVDVGETVGILDRKLRLARRIAARFAWEPANVGCALIVAEGRTNRRRIADHRATFGSALPGDGRRFRAWLRRPASSIEAVAFWPNSRPRAARQGHGGARRVRAVSRQSQRA